MATEISIQNSKKRYTHGKQFKRVAYLVFGILVAFTFFFGMLNYAQGLNYSGFFSFVLSFAYTIAGYIFIFKRKILLATLITYLSLLCILPVAIYLEGIMSGHHLYFFTMIFAIPFIIKREKRYEKYTKALYVLTFIFIIVSSVVSPMYTNVYPELTQNATHGKLMINTVVCFFIIIFFSFIVLKRGEIFVKSIVKQKQRAEDEKSSRTRVLSNLGHELRTQVNSINGVTQLILDEDTTPSEQKRYLSTLDYCNNNMLSLVNDMLDLHKIEEGKFELFLESKNLFDIVNNSTIAFENLIYEKKLEFISEIDPQLKHINVRVDGVRLTQVLHNLLSNAVKYTKQGSIIFKTEVQQVSNDNIDVRFSIKDSGIGIAKEDIDRIFDSFQQIKTEDSPIYGGTGLGLAITKTIVEKMNSTIHVNSAVNKGSEFYFTISFDIDANSFSNSSTVSSDAKELKFLKGKHILVVEDNPISMLFTNKLLTKYGATTYQAVNGLEAVERVKQEHTKLDLVLLDLEMPKMTGFEAITPIKDIAPNLTVVAFSANVPDQQLLQKLKYFGFDEILSKPFKKEELIDTLNRCLPVTNTNDVVLK